MLHDRAVMNFVCVAGVVRLGRLDCTSLTCGFVPGVVEFNLNGVLEWRPW